MNLVFENRERFVNLYREHDAQKGGEDRVCPSPFTNRINVLVSNQEAIKQFGTYDTLDFFPDRYKVNIYTVDSIPKDIKYIIPVGVHEAPVNWTGISGRYNSIFENINETYLNHLREGRAYILFDNSLEGYEDPKLYDFFDKEAQKYNIPKKNIIFISGNTLLEDRAREWSEKTGKENVSVFGYTHFEFDMFKNVEYFNENNQPIPTFEDHIKYKEANLPAIKTYNCLNRKPRAHRVWFYNKLFHTGLLTKGLVSMNPWTDAHESIEIDGQYNDVEDLRHSFQFTPMTWDGITNMDNPGQKINRLNEKSMLNSWITVVSEAQFNDNQKTVFLSEKTFKSIACCHPFVILGSKHSLRELKKLGYVTFDNLIDESYDELDNIDRIEAIIELLYRLADNRDALQHFKWHEPRLKHNLEVLKFNSLFKPPNGFHFINDLCYTKKEKILP